ncbi:MAG: oligoendopeptidase F, partial [Helicobacter apodemus]|nr:oligoendopeptidase F [Helicobacter apodemus]
KSVDLMVQTIDENVKIVEEYYNIKRELLSYDKLYDYDRYAPLPMSNNEVFNYEDSKKIILDTFKDFSTKFYEIAKKAFEEGWIDSHPRDNKRGGAFSHSGVASAHPYLLLNHTNQRRDVFTIAHELGHTIHQNLSYSVGYLNSDTPLTTAETASVFAEMLLFENIKDSLKKEEKIALYAGKLEDIFATLFRQNVFTNFERRIHTKEGELSTEEINTIWQDENQKMFGDSVVLSENYCLWWSYIPHFIHTPFYCYAYSYGQLLVMALFGVYREEGKSFIPKYEKFLSLGGSQSPKDLVAIFGLDIEDKDFWKIGINEVRLLLEELKGIL